MNARAPADGAFASLCQPIGHLLRQRRFPVSGAAQRGGKGSGGMPLNRRQTQCRRADMGRAPSQQGQPVRPLGVQVKTQVQTAALSFKMLFAGHLRAIVNHHGWFCRIKGGGERRQPG